MPFSHSGFHVASKKAPIGDGVYPLDSATLISLDFHAADVCLGPELFTFLLFCSFQDCWARFELEGRARRGTKLGTHGLRHLFGTSTDLLVLGRHATHWLQWGNGLTFKHTEHIQLLQKLKTNSNPKTLKCQQV